MLDCNVFAVEFENEPPTSPGALISAIQVTYTDGTTYTMVSDGTWRANNAIPGFQNPGYNDVHWPHAVVLGNANSSPWHTPTLPPPLSPLTLSVNLGFGWTHYSESMDSSSVCSNSILDPRRLILPRVD